MQPDVDDDEDEGTIYANLYSSICGMFCDLVLNLAVEFKMRIVDPCKDAGKHQQSYSGSRVNIDNESSLCS